MPIAALVYLVACSPSPQEGFRPPPSVTDVRWIQDGITTALDDASFTLNTVTALDGSCEPTLRILLRPRSTTYQAFIDLSAYRSGADVLTPSGPHPLRFPTLVRFTPVEVERRSAPSASDTGAPPQYLRTTWSGGPATFAIGADFVHTLSLEAPTACGPEGCAPSTPVTLAFTGDLTEVQCTLEAVGGDGQSPSGLPYCVAGAYGDCPPLGYDD